MHIGGEQLRIGPVTNSQLLYILLDRSLLFYGHIINWSHGRRDYDAGKQEVAADTRKEGVTAYWNKGERRIAEHFFRVASAGNGWASSEAAQDMRGLLLQQMQQIAEDSRK